MVVALVVVAEVPDNPPNDRVGLALAVVDAVEVVEVSNPPSRGLDAEEVAGLPRVSPPVDKAVVVCCDEEGKENPIPVDAGLLAVPKLSPDDVVTAVVVAVDAPNPPNCNPLLLPNCNPPVVAEVGFACVVVDGVPS